MKEIIEKIGEGRVNWTRDVIAILDKLDKYNFAFISDEMQAEQDKYKFSIFIKEKKEIGAKQERKNWIKNVMYFSIENGKITFLINAKGLWIGKVSKENFIKMLVNRQYTVYVDVEQFYTAVLNIISLFYHYQEEKK